MWSCLLGYRLDEQKQVPQIVAWAVRCEVWSCLLPTPCCLQLWSGFEFPLTPMGVLAPGSAHASQKVCPTFVDHIFLLQVIYYFRKSKYNNKLRAKHKNPRDLPEKYIFYFAMWKFSLPSDKTISIHIFSFRLIINFFYWTVFIFQFVQMQNCKENPT